MKRQRRRSKEAGITMVELCIAVVVLMIAALSIIVLVSMSIATNNRNKVDSTQTMLAESIIEQVTSTIIGSGSSQLTDCNGTTWTIDTQPGVGANLSGTNIDFTQASPPAGYYMNYVVNSPCTSTGARQAIYDVRWNVEIVGESLGTPTNSYVITVGAKKKGGSQDALTTSAPLNIRLLAGN